MMLSSIQMKRLVTLHNKLFTEYCHLYDLKNNNWFQTGFLKHSNFNQCPHLLLVRQTSSPTPNICYWLCHKLTNWTAQTNILIAPQSFSVSLLVKIKLLTWLTIEVLLNREKSILALGGKFTFEEPNAILHA